MYLLGIIYEYLIEPLIKNVKVTLADYINSKENIFPLIDICCGTGAQCRLIDNKRGVLFGLDIDRKIKKCSQKN